VTDRSAAARLLLGIAISAAFLVLVIARVDLAQVAAVIQGAAPGLLVLGLATMVVDLLIRATRWSALLAPIVAQPPSVLRAASYLMIGYFANSLLPARLGDVARAYLAGTAFGASRLATFGTVLVERVADGLTMVGLVVVSSLLVVTLAQLQELGIQAVLLGAAGGLGLAAAAIGLRYGPLARTRLGRLGRDYLRRVGAGGTALRRPRGVTVVLGTTLLAAATASLVSAIVAAAVGLQLSPAQVVLFTSGIALSLAIPAAPSSLGTFEFAGVLILTSFGATAELGLAVVLLVRLVTTVPLAIGGLIVTWATHLRPAALFATAAAIEAGSDGR
jgi:uncharacterized membrane protein YbhN (UPF0104 family)